MPALRHRQPAGDRLLPRLRPAPDGPRRASRGRAPEPPEGTQACPRCGTHNRAGVAFCQNCGANLRAAEAGTCPRRAAGDAAVAQEQERSGHAVLGPVVLLIGALGMATGWLLPFAFGSGVALGPRLRRSGWLRHRLLARLPDRGLAAQAYFGLAAPVPILVALLAGAGGGRRRRPRRAMLQVIGLLVSLVWAVGLLVLFLVVELLGATEPATCSACWPGSVPAGIILPCRR